MCLCIYAYVCFSFYICICYISQRNQSAFRLMHGIYCACYKSIWNSQQKHIKPIRKTKNTNLLENLLEAYFESASLSDYTHRYYPHAKRELSSIRADRNNNKKKGDSEVCAVRLASFTYSTGGILFTCYEFRHWWVGGCWLLQGCPGGGISWWMLQDCSQRLKVQERLWDSKDVARPICFEEKWCDCFRVSLPMQLVELLH